MHSHQPKAFNAVRFAGRPSPGTYSVIWRPYGLRICSAVVSQEVDYNDPAMKMTAILLSKAQGTRFVAQISFTACLPAGDYWLICTTSQTALSMIVDYTWRSMPHVHMI